MNEELNALVDQIVTEYLHVIFDREKGEDIILFSHDKEYIELIQIFDRSVTNINCKLLDVTITVVRQPDYTECRFSEIEIE